MPRRFELSFELPQDRLLARLCAAGAMLMLVVLVASAALRLGRAGCIDTLLPAMAVTAARVTHRIAASLVGVLLLAMVWLALWRRQFSRAGALLLCGACAATIFLAVLGRASAGSTTPLVIIGNVAVGVILYVLLRQLQLQFRPRRPMHFSDGRLRAIAGATRAVAGLQIWLGAWAAGMAAQLGCGGMPAGTPWWLPLPQLAAFDPLQATAATDAIGALRSVQLLHEASALALLLLAVPLALRLQGFGGDTRRDANRLLLALALQAGLGIAIALADTAPWLGAAHTALAAIVLGIVMRMHIGLRRT